MARRISLCLRLDFADIVRLKEIARKTAVERQADVTHIDLVREAIALCYPKPPTPEEIKAQEESKKEWGF